MLPAVNAAIGNRMHFRQDKQKKVQSIDYGPSDCSDNMVSEGLVSVEKR